MSLVTCGWATLLIGLAFVARPILNALINFGGRDLVSLIVWFGFLVFLAGLVGFRRRLSQINFVTWIIFFIGVSYAVSIPIAEERIHLIKYGVLGVLVARDNVVRYGHRALFAAFCVGASVAMADETIQYALPDRVGDLRDLFFGVVGSLWGGTLFLSQSRSKN